MEKFKNMKRISFILLSYVFLQATTFGQAPKDTAYVKDVYLDLENNIVNQRVMEFDSTSVTDLMRNFFLLHATNLHYC